MKYFYKPHPNYIVPFKISKVLFTLVTNLLLEALSPEVLQAVHDFLLTIKGFS